LGSMEICIGILMIIAVVIQTIINILVYFVIKDIYRKI